MANRYFEAESHTKLYQKFRPTTPPELVQYVLTFLNQKYDGELNLAVDVGCGSGQNTFQFAEHFKHVLGTDVSPNQISQAKAHNLSDNVNFEISPAEKLTLENDSVQLITAMAAVHWFDIPAFLTEAYRILCPGGAIALYCYAFAELKWEEEPSKNEELNRIYNEEVFLSKELIEYWPEDALNHVSTKYREITIPSPFVDFFRVDGMFFQEKKRNINSIFDHIQTGPGFQKFREDKGEKIAQKYIADGKEKFLRVIAANVGPEDKDKEDAFENIYLTMQTSFFILLARKPGD